MSFYQRLHFFVFLWSLSFLALFINSLQQMALPRPRLAQDSHPRRAHAFLLGNKMSIHEASIADIALIPGVSRAVARRVKAMFATKSVRLDQLGKQQGIGERTIIKLHRYFY